MKWRDASEKPDVVGSYLVLEDDSFLKERVIRVAWWDSSGWANFHSVISWLDLEIPEQYLAQEPVKESLTTEEKQLREKLEAEKAELEARKFEAQEKFIAKIKEASDREIQRRTKELADSYQKGWYATATATPDGLNERFNEKPKGEWVPYSKIESNLNRWYWYRFYGGKPCALYVSGSLNLRDYYEFWSIPIEEPPV